MNNYLEIDLDHISFAEWLVKLDECAAKAGYTGNQTFTQITGLLSWFSHYEEGQTPETALEMATKDGACFESDYKNLQN